MFLDMFVEILNGSLLLVTDRTHVAFLVVNTCFMVPKVNSMSVGFAAAVMVADMVLKCSMTRYPMLTKRV